jgi:hypothetical protein
MNSGNSTREVMTALRSDRISVVRSTTLDSTHLQLAPFDQVTVADEPALFWYIASFSLTKVVESQLLPGFELLLSCIFVSLLCNEGGICHFPRVGLLARYEPLC